MNSSDKRPSGGGDDTSPLDRAALSALLREVHATHFFVWSMNSGGALSSVNIPVTDIAQQIGMAIRMLDGDLDEAIKLTQSASTRFDSVAHRWESQARQSELKLRSDRAARRLNDAKAKHNVVRNRIVPVQSLFRRAALSLQEMSLKKRKQEADFSAKDVGAEDEDRLAKDGDSEA